MNSELASPAVTPIYHQRYYKGEREIFGYAPSFVPNVVTFDRQNQPYMRTGTTVQWLRSRNGPWETVDLARFVAAQYPAWNRDTSSLTNLGFNVDEHVVFDQYDNAYTYLDAVIWENVGVPLILYRPRAHEDWQVYAPPTTLRFGYPEYPDGHNDRSEPPVFFFTSYFGPKSRGSGPVELVMPRRNRDGTLSFGPPITVATDALPHVRPAGGSNLTATIGDRVHVVWASRPEPPKPDQSGTPTWIATYSRKTGGIIADPKLLGYADVGNPDEHNLPAITVDSGGYLHVVLGAHNEQFKYTRSLQPNDITGGFTPLVSLGGRKASDGKDPECNDDQCFQYSYVSLVCDQDDTLHIVARWAGDTPGYTYYWRLAYLRKKAGLDWEPRRTLVVPFKNFYSNWYQKLSVDDRGRLFLNYRYYGDNLFADEVAAYRAKWPEDGLVLIPDKPNCTPTTSYDPSPTYCNYSKTVRAHDPVLLISDDGGDSFRVAPTRDFEVENDGEVENRTTSERR